MTATTGVVDDALVAVWLDEPHAAVATPMPMIANLLKSPVDRRRSI